MKKRPLFFNIMILILALVPMSFIGQIAWIYQHNPITELNLIFQKLTYLNYITMGVLLLGIPLYQRASRILLLWIPVSFFVVALNNWSVSKYGQDFKAWETLLASTLYIGLTLITLRQKYLKIILNPALRWWRCSKRWPIGIPVKIKTKCGKTIAAQTFDISRTGAFVKTHETLDPEDKKVLIEIPSSSGSFTLEAKIIRSSGPQGHYPAGIGVQFSKLDLGGRLFLQKLTQPAF